jgi:hypothetical protein
VPLALPARAEQCEQAYLNQTAEVIDVKEPEPQDEFVRGLALIYQRLKQSKHLKKAMREVESSLLELLGVRLFTIYQCVQNGKEVLASFKGGTPTTTTLLKSVCLSAPLP